MRPQLRLAAGRTIEQRIVGGTKATKGEFPSIVSLQTGTFPFCAGTLIAPDWVVTAAHCQGHYDPINVVVGRLDLRTSEGEVFQVGGSAIKVAKRYNVAAQFDFDVALIRLPGKADAPVMELHTGPISGSATAIGWGATSFGGPSSPDLLKAVVPIVPFDTCQTHYPALTQHMVCAGQVGRDSCSGDSGGPFIFDGKLAGIVSYGRGCAGPDPGVYAQVSGDVGDWIKRCAR